VPTPIPGGNDASHNLIRALLATLNSQYFDPTGAAAMESAITKRELEGAYNLPDGPALAGRLTADLHAVVPDQHLRVEYSSGPLLPAGAPGAVDQQLTDATFVRQEKYGFPTVRTLAGNIGYIEIARFFAPELAA
jgi:hypothetical protein